MNDRLRAKLEAQRLTKYTQIQEILTRVNKKHSEKHNPLIQPIDCPACMPQLRRTSQIQNQIGAIDQQLSQG